MKNFSDPYIGKPGTYALQCVYPYSRHGTDVPGFPNIWVRKILRGLAMGVDSL